MSYEKTLSNAVNRYFHEVTSRVVAESGIPSDQYHIGKIMFKCLQEDPGFVIQIDGATGQSDTCASVLQKSIECAVAYRNFGLTGGDVIVSMTSNYLDTTIPVYAALYTGVSVATLDKNYKSDEMEASFKKLLPKIIFCDKIKKLDIKTVLQKLKHTCIVIAIDDIGDNSLKKFIMKYKDDKAEKIFKPTNFDPDKTIAFLLSTSGTTGLPKCACLSHKSMLASTSLWLSMFDEFPRPTRMIFMSSPLQWISAVTTHLLSVIYRITRLQTSLEHTTEHIIELIDKYKPTFTINNPTFMTSLIRTSIKCDLSSFEAMVLGGSAVTHDIMDDIKRSSPNIAVVVAYGMTEIGIGYGTIYKPTLGPCFQNLGILKDRLVDVDSGKDILEHNVPGELWVRGPSVYKGYYKSPEDTADAYSEDGWFKTGDIMKKDEYGYYYYMDRLKMLMKYLGLQISPIELEVTIRQHPAVLEVAVSSVPDQLGDMPVACVVPRPGVTVTAQEIKDFVKDNLADYKQLRGGVIFVESVPFTVTNKIDRKALKQLVAKLPRE